ncbi:MAG TPA: hypothetical protein VG755_43755 [Nannocystaceae bacterium]|nr:hypothetical protein [Nannocystaceae bacterium]
MSSCLVAACGDDAQPVVVAETSGDETTIGSSISDTFESVSATADETFSDVGPDVTSSPTFPTTDSDPSDTFDTSITDPDTSDESFTTITDSDTFDTSAESDSDSFTTSTTDGTSTTDPTSMTDSDPSMTDSDPSTTTDPSASTTLTTTDTDPSVSTTDPVTTDPSVSTTDPTDATSTTDPTDATTTTDPTDATSTTDPTDTDPTDGGGFPPAPAFGTNVLDFDLVGVWGLNWDPASGFDSVIDIDDQGNFMWTESSADCSTETVASGFLWVEGIQIVMHVELWDRQLPWDTEPVTGETYPPPFRLRSSFSLQGSGPDDYLVLAAPSRITEAAPYSGESYVQIDAQGDFLAGTWHGEAQLDAIPAGEVDPVVIVRDTYEAQLGPELAADDPQGMGTRVVTTQYFPVAQQFQTFDGANWTCLSGCPDPSGLTLVDGSNLYTYGPYAGFEHLLTFESGRTFRAGAASDCP